MNQYATIEHTFRLEYGQLVASILRRVGAQHIDAVEDAVQYSLMQAVDLWCRQGTPDNPSAWLYLVAYRKFLTELRDIRLREHLLVQQSPLADEYVTDYAEIPLLDEMNDSFLRMLFVACNDAIPVESQMVFTLKSLCGFSIREIALRLFISEANVYKRFSRARQYLVKNTVPLDVLSDADIKTRLPMVHRVLYLVFTEGYLSSHCDKAIRIDLCEEAIHLTQLLSESTMGKVAETFALLALMYLHLARMNTRQDDSGALLLLEQQDRSQWDQPLIAAGLGFLKQSTRGDNLSRYHIEARILAEHCLAPTFKQTRWDQIVASYELLERIAPSPLHCLNRAVAMAEWKGPKEGLAVLQFVDIPDWLARSYYWHAVQADLFYRCGEKTLACNSAGKAIQAAPTADIKCLLHKRLAKCGLSP